MSRPGRSLPPGKTRYPLYRRLGGPQGRSGQVRKISPPPGFDTRTVQPVASRYTDYSTRPTTTFRSTKKFCAFSQGPHKKPKSDQKSEGPITTEHYYTARTSRPKPKPISVYRDTKAPTTQSHCMVAAITCVSSCDQLGTG